MPEIMDWCLKCGKETPETYCPSCDAERILDGFVPSATLLAVTAHSDPHRKTEQLHKEENMELLPAEVRGGLPKLYAQDGSRDATVHVKYFTPDSSWTWYATEGEPDGDDFRFFGFVIGYAREWGYFMLSEMESARGPLGLPIERDLHFTPAPLSEVLKREGRGQD